MKQHPFQTVIYLIFPSPAPLPPLPNGLKSDEPGDTVQIPGIYAYYTDLSRQEIISFYQNNYTNSRLFKFPFITYRLNYPPLLQLHLVMK